VVEVVSTSVVVVVVVVVAEEADHQAASPSEHLRVLDRDLPKLPPPSEALTTPLPPLAFDT
jgi:hypothetical protein